MIENKLRIERIEFNKFDLPSIQPTAQICPVCHGKGFVPYWFYGTQQEVSTSTVHQTKCRSCAGAGYVIVR